MSRVIGFSGAHGTGKTTLLTALNLKNYSGVVVDTESMSRKVQKELNGADATLESVVSDPANVTRFQERILTEKSLHIVQILANTPAASTILTDRTPVDCYAYARMWTERHKFTGWEHWLYTYWTSCIKDMHQYERIVLLPPAAFNFVSEGQRADQDTQQQHASYCNDFIDSIPLRNVHTVTSLSIEDRVSEMTSILQLF